MAEPVIRRTSFQGDAGQAADAMAKALCEYHGRTGRKPEHLVVGVDLYEAVAVNASLDAARSYSDLGVLFGYTDNRMTAVYPDMFMGVPLIVVPDPGMVRAVGSTYDMLMMHGGKPAASAKEVSPQ